MSYVIHLWDSKLSPAKYADAESFLTPLSNFRVTEPESKFRALVDHVNRAFGIADEEDLCKIWLEDPSFDGSALLTLGIVTSEITMVIPVVHTAARELGLVVFDGQAGEVYLPQGTGFSHLGTMSPEDWSTAACQPDDELSQYTVLRSMGKLVGPVLRGYGFGPGSGENWYRKSTADLEICVDAKVYWDKFTLWIYVRPYAPEDRPDAEKMLTSLPSLVLDLPCLAERHQVKFSARPEDRYLGFVECWPAKNWEQVNRLAQELQQLFASRGFQFLGTLNTVADLDRLANQVPDEDCPFLDIRNHTIQNGRLRQTNYLNLVVAYLAGNPNFETLARNRYEACRAGDTVCNLVADDLRDLYALMGLTV
jgi:hypothetical protein